MRMNLLRYGLVLTAIVSTFVVTAQENVNALIQKVNAKIEKVNDYTAEGKMKTKVVFLKVPVSAVKIYFKKPNRLKIKNEKGISFVPKGAVSINISNIVNGEKYTALDAGMDKIGNTAVRVVKLLPVDDNADIVLSTIYIDETNLLIKKAKTTTRENGSYELEMTYGKYSSYGLPDKIIFTFNTKEYKLPKGITFDFDDGEAAKKSVPKGLNKNQGRAEITFDSYIINKGVSDGVF
jgi:outer membrane lipoprotein-sorting protein